MQLQSLGTSATDRSQSRRTIEYNLDFRNHFFRVTEGSTKSIILVTVEVPKHLVIGLEVIVQDCAGVTLGVVRDNHT